jgi:hypothetical protein
VIITTGVTAGTEVVIVEALTAIGGVKMANKEMSIGGMTRIDTVVTITTEDRGDRTYFFI